LLLSPFFLPFSGFFLAAPRMPFGRLGKTNRSQHALPVVEQQSPAPPSANNAQELCAETPGSGASSQPANPNLLHSASPSGFSSRESLETRSSQQHQQQEAPARES